MDVGQMRGELDRTLAAIRRLDDSEQALLRKLETVRSERARLDAEVQSTVRTAERAELEPQEYGLLFGTELRAVMTAAITRAVLT
jgi:hypothetical protein